MSASDIRNAGVMTLMVIAVSVWSIVAVVWFKQP
jgi:hypothetical protein